MVMAAALVASVVAGAAWSDPIDSGAAKEMLFAPDAMALAPADLSAFSPELKAHYERIVSGEGGRMFVVQAQAGGLGYFGAIAAPTATAPTMETLTMGGNAHSPGSAAREVLAQCQAAAGEDCAVVAYLVPEGYSAQPLTLSAPATDAVMSDFGKGDGPRYLAYSPSTAGFAVVKGAGADAVALETCNEATGGRNDCVIGVVER
jgi:hypothetical protein